MTSSLFDTILVWNCVVFVWSIVLFKVSGFLELDGLQVVMVVVSIICIIIFALLGTTFFICSNQVWPCLPQ
jgi:hypothetical protein